MKLEINFISSEVINPSSQTPKHYNLSSLDQTTPHVLMPHVFFYPSNNNNTANSQISNQLKTSLSQTLTQFYPLAGRLVGNSYVDCNNDTGVTYIEAQANFKLCDVITDPINIEELNKFIPCNPYEATDVCLIVQVTFLRCGGLAIGLGISHKIADAFSYFMFVNTWAATSRGDVYNNIQSPILETATLFPPRNDLDFDVAVAKKQNIKVVKKRFVFSAQKVSELREKYTLKDVRPTRIEALSTFIWTRFMVATGAKDDKSKVFVLLFPVDIRTRMVPSLSEYHFGNIIMRAITTTLSLEDENLDAAGYGIVNKIRDAIRNINGDYVAKKIRDGVKTSDNAAKNMLSEGEEVCIFKFSSLCRLPLYEADFGWGIPVWVGSGKTPVSNAVHFTSSFSGDGIEAWVNLTEEDMIKFEADEELLDYVSCVNRK